MVLRGLMENNLQRKQETSRIDGHFSQICTGGGAFGLTELKRSSSSSSANRLCAAGLATLSLEL